MGWGSLDPWAGDGPCDLKAHADQFLEAGLVRLLGWGTGFRVHDLRGDAWAKDVKFYPNNKSVKKKTGRVWDDPMNTWTIVGVIALALNNGHWLDARVLEWAERMCRDLAGNQKFLDLWTVASKEPIEKYGSKRGKARVWERIPIGEERRKSLLHFAGQFQKIVKPMTDAAVRTRRRVARTRRLMKRRIQIGTWITRVRAGRIEGWDKGGETPPT